MLSNTCCLQFHKYHSYARNRGEICKCLNKYQTSFNWFFIPFSSKFSPETIFYSWQLPQMTMPFFTVGKFEIFKLHLSVDNPASGNRKTTYFGDVSYRYGRIKHEANPYPQCDLFKTMFEKLKGSRLKFLISVGPLTCALSHCTQTARRPFSDQVPQ